MIYVKLFVIGILLLTGCTPGETEVTVEKKAAVFESGQEGYACFRIPATVVAPSGALLAFAEGRKNGCSDTGDIDLVIKRSEDGGLTWSALAVVWSDAENVSGNPAPVVDEETGEIFLLSTWNLGVDREPQIIDQTSQDTRHIFVLSSKDDGRTWSEPREITDDVKLPNWTWYATGPGSGIQIRRGPHAGRLMIACDHIEAETKHYYSHVIFSDDHGQTWLLGGSTPQHQVNESEVAELSDGRLLLNMRNYDRSQRSRKIAWSDDGGASWSDIQPDTTLIEPICQASLQRHQFEGEGGSMLLFSNPASETKRDSMTVRVSYDEGQTWPVSMLLHTGQAAYSDLVTLPNGDAGILYEVGPSQDEPYRAIVFERIARDRLIDRPL